MKTILYVSLSSITIDMFGLPEGDVECLPQSLFAQRVQ